MKPLIFTPRRIFKGALLGGLVASVVNTALYFLGRAMGASFYVEPEGGEAGAIPFVMPAVVTMLAALIAAILLVILVKVVPNRAWGIFLFIAVAVFLLYAILPVRMLPGDMISILFLELMHIPSAVCIVGGIRAYCRE